VWEGVEVGGGARPAATGGDEGLQRLGGVVDGTGFEDGTFVCALLDADRCFSVECTCDLAERAGEGGSAFADVVVKVMPIIFIIGSDFIDAPQPAALVFIAVPVGW